MSENENKESKENKPWWRWGFALIVIFFIGYSTFSSFKLSFELLTALALLLFFFVYDDIKEISIGSILSIKKKVEEVAKEQEKLFMTVNALAVNQRTEQNVNVQIPEKDNLPDKKETAITKEILSEVINQNKEYYSHLKQWEEYSKIQNQTVDNLNKELDEARKVINGLFVDKEIAEFNYLNYFFVYNTKRLLNWLVNKGTASRLEFIYQSSVLGIAQDNIGVTIDVLRLNNMIEVNNDIFSATSRAKIFLDYIGFKDPVLPTGGLLSGLYSSLSKK